MHFFFQFRLVEEVVGRSGSDYQLVIFNCFKLSADGRVLTVDFQNLAEMEFGIL